MSSPIADFTVRRYAAFAQLPPSVRAAADVAGSGQRYDQTLPWLEAFVEHFGGAGVDLDVAVAWRGERPLAMLPLARGLLGGREARYGASVGNYYSFNAEPFWLADDADRASVGAALVDACAQGTARGGGFVIAPIDSASPFWQAAQVALGRRGYHTEAYFRFVNWWLDLEGRDYAAYEAGLAGNVRNTLHRKRKKLEKSGRVELRIVRHPADVPAGMDAYESVYARSWQRHEAHPAFIRDVARRFAERGWLRLGLLLRDGEPLAAQLWFVFGGSAAIFKLVFDEQHSDLSPGSVLTSHLLRKVVDEDRVRIVDFLSGDDSYKRQWMNRRSEMWGIRAVPAWSPSGLVSRARTLSRRLLGRVRAPPASALVVS